MAPLGKSAEVRIGKRPPKTSNSVKQQRWRSLYLLLHGKRDSLPDWRTQDSKE